MKLSSLDTVVVRSELARVGQDSEYADMGNPNGDLYADRYFVSIVIADRDLNHFHPFVEEVEAEAFAAKIAAVGVIDEDLWGTRWHYGTPQNQAEELEAEAREIGDEAGPGEEDRFRRAAGI